MIQIPKSIQSKSMYELIQLAYVDNLTGVGNRNLLEELRSDFEEDDYFFVAIIDVDDLKIRNDKYGPAAGDELLKHIALDLQKAADWVFRLGGDEFLLVDNYDPILILSSIPNISYGVVRKKQFEELSHAMHEADKKMYEMKAQHRKERQYDNRVKNAETRQTTE